ncbi:hypothetical protein O181_090846 [Austropuccinia psidii MF-1]|uniref:Uncharacterized protein n=1 Tax=Austropuccinia psidii MF-1 TaxID=1389203 RepID=A0A9Q3IWC8_9BASI|nr:hypothetical protein [Austropuccinia psidii MF-1]
MPVEHSPPVRQTRSQDRAQAVLTPTPRAPLEGTPAVPQLRANLDREPVMEGKAPSRKEGRGPGRSIFFSGSVETFTGISRTKIKVPSGDDSEEEAYSTEAAPTPVGASQGTGG